MPTVFVNQSNEALYRRLIHLGLEQSKAFVAVLEWNTTSPHAGAWKCIDEAKHLLKEQ